MFSSVDEPSDGVGVAFTDRWGGVSTGPLSELNLGRTDIDEPGRVIENYLRVRAALSLTTVHVVNQVHGTAVHHVDEHIARRWTPAAVLGDGVPGQASLPVADAQVTSIPGAGIAIRVADCLPVLLASPRARIVAAVHAGRVGLLSGAITVTISVLRALGAEEISAWIGPHICGDCYEVPDEMAADAAERLPVSAGTTSWGTASIDLAAGAVHQLESAQVQVEYVGGCTRTSPDHFSHRADSASGRQIGVIWLKP